MDFRKSTLLIICIPLAILLFLETGTLLHTIKGTWTGHTTDFGNYKWMALGVILFMTIHYMIIRLHWPFKKGTGKANLEAMETFMHEFTHQIVALLLGRRLHSFHSERYSGMVYTSGNENTHLPVALAPYCLPWLTLLFVVTRVMIKPEWIWFYDIIMGLSAGFHGMCFYKDTSSKQPDINQYPLYFSYLYIVTFLVFNIMITSVSIGKNFDIVDTGLYILNDFWKTISSIFN